MQIEKVLPVILILGIISLYFFVTGIKAFVQKRMRIFNPFADRQAFSISDLIFNTLKKKVESDYKVPENFVDKRTMIDITGRDLIIRAWIHIFLGIITIFVLIIFLSPNLFEKIMNIFF